MPDDPTTQNLDDAERAMQAYAEEQYRRQQAALSAADKWAPWRAITPAPISPDMARRLGQLLQATAYAERRTLRQPYIQSPIVYDPQPETARGYRSDIWMPAIAMRGDNDHQWRRMQRRLRRAERLRTMQGIIRRTVLRYPWLTLPLTGWAAIYGLCRLIGWLVSITF